MANPLKIFCLYNLTYIFMTSLPVFYNVLTLLCGFFFCMYMNNNYTVPMPYGLCFTY